MDEFLAPIHDAFEGQIVSFGHLAFNAVLPRLSIAPTLTWPLLSEQDFSGQRTTELLSTGLLTISGVAAFLVGYILQDIHLTLWTGLAGTLFTGLIVIPPWRFYNMNPEKWLIPSAGGTGSR